MVLLKSLVAVCILLLMTSCSSDRTASPKAPDRTAAARTEAPGSVRAPLPPASELKVALLAQEASQWCWAASAQMILQFLTKTVIQCDEANLYFNKQNCCTPTGGRGTPCDEGGWPEFDKYGYIFSRKSEGALEWDQIKAEIAAGRPVAFSWRWVGGGGHMMVATGYTDDGDGRNVLANDPDPPWVGRQITISYEAYVSADDHSHWDDFYNIRRK